MFPPLSLLSSLGLKSTLPHISIVTPASYQFPLAWYIIFYSFTFSLCVVSLPVRYVFYIQQMVGFFRPISQSLLIGELNPFTFRVMVERCLLFPVILLYFSRLISRLILFVLFFHLYSS
jgi:hypothetical protein